MASEDKHDLKADAGRSALPNAIIPPEMRGGNDMASGADSWDDMENRFTDPHLVRAEYDPDSLSRKNWSVLKKLKLWLQSQRDELKRAEPKQLD